MSVELRPARLDEISELRRALGLGFGFDSDPAYDEPFLATAELDRTRCAYDGPELVGTLGCYSLELAVPGATLPTGGTTWITVRATHRRRGLLRAMLAAHFEDVRERGEALAALWASESSIYGRFGYGCAADLMRVEVERARSAFEGRSGNPGCIRLLSLEDALKLGPAVYERLWRTRPGSFARSATWWEKRRFDDAPFLRDGATALRFALYELEGQAQGYAQYRVKMSSNDHGLPTGSLRLIELQAETPAAHAALWRHVLDIDLLDRLVAWNVPVDDPLPLLLADPRRAMRSVRDALWIRVMDVSRALSARCYATGGSLVLRIRDTTLPDQDGTYTLEAGPKGAACRRSDARPELSLDIRDLGAVYLGGVGFRTLARAGRVQGEGDALARADAMFRWDPAPWCPEVF